MEEKKEITLEEVKKKLGDLIVNNNDVDLYEDPFSAILGFPDLEESELLEVLGYVLEGYENTSNRHNILSLLLSTQPIGERVWKSLTSDLKSLAIYNPRCIGTRESVLHMLSHAFPKMIGYSYSRVVEGREEEEDDMKILKSYILLSLSSLRVERIEGKFMEVEIDPNNIRYVMDDILGVEFFHIVFIKEPRMIGEGLGLWRSLKR